MPTVTVVKSVPRVRYQKRTLTTVNPVSQTYSAGALSLTDWREGTNVPNWRYRIRNHLNAASFLTGEKWRASGGFGQHYMSFWNGPLPPGNGRFCYANTTGFLVWLTKPVISIDATRADNEARQKFYKQVKSAQTAFRSLTALGELRETLSMIRNPAKGLRRGLDDYLRSVTKRTRKVKKKSTKTRIVAETWLEHAFGWSPLISDIRSAGDALNRRLERYQGSYTRVSAQGKDETWTYGGLVTNQGETGTNRDWTFSTLQGVTVKCYGVVRSVCPSPVQADMTLFGANWREIVPTAWELVPWSFVVDYFTNIGDILDAWSVRKSDIAWSVTTTRKRVRRKTDTIVDSNSFSGFNPYPGTPTQLVLTCSPAVIVGTSVRRDPYVGVPSNPSLEWEIPGFGSKWINLSALAVSVKRTRRQLFS